jgi:GPH family glycoside/pentoside/hexuronide:cation symporter
VKKFPFGKQMVYCGGNAGFAIFDSIFAIYFIFFLLPPRELGLPNLISTQTFYGITVIGLIIILGRIIDSIADPLIANWSDNSRFSMGRRKFFIVTGSLPFAVFSVLLFFPPDNSISIANAVYEAIVLCFFFFFYTYFMTPYLALIPELSRTHGQRITITVAQAYFSLIGAAVVMMGVPLIWDALKGGSLEVTGSFRVAIIVVSVIGFITAIASGLVVNEKEYSRGQPADVHLFESIKLTLKNKSFIQYVIPTILFWCAFHMIRAIIPYYSVVLLQKDQAFQMMLMIVLFGSAAVFFFIVGFLTKFLTNKTIMLAGLLSFAAFMCITYFVKSFGDMAVTGAYIHMALLGFPVAVLLVIPNAMVADISEVDAHETGKNREAMFFGTQGLLMKINYGIAGALLSFLLLEFGKDVSNPLGVELSGPVAGLFPLVGFFILLMYPQKWINDKLKEIRQKE